MKEQPKKSIRLWIARDSDGKVYGYTNKPTKKSDVWDTNDNLLLPLPQDSFPNIKWDDTEPIRACLKLV